MTLTDTENKNNGIVDNKMDIGGALRDVLQCAKREGRITSGVYESGKMLELNPDGVMLCILPVNASDDVTMHIHFTLIEAFCWENEIRLLKVDSLEKIAKILGDNKPLPINDNDIAAGRALRTSDFNCVLVEYPQEGSTEADEDVAEFCKIASEMTPQPIINLAV